MFKKTLAWLLTLCMVLSMVPVSVFATELAGVDDKSATSAIEQNAADGAADLTISTVEGLQEFAAAVNGGNSYEGKTVVLADDIDLNFTAVIIGTMVNPFKGTFDGQNHTVSNLTIYEDGSESDYLADTDNYVGLFGVINTPAVVKNVTVDNPFIVGSAYVGGIVGCAYTGTIQNCHVTGEIDIEGYYMVGGITGHGYAEIHDCSVIGAEGWDYNVIGAKYKESNLEGDNVGGIVGHNAENNTLSGCTVENVTVSGTRKVGGIVGITAQSTDISNCSVSNVIVETVATAEYAEANAKTMSIGGIVGQYMADANGTGGTLTDCSACGLTFANKNDVTVNAGAITGGVRGSSETTEQPASGNITISGNNTSNVTGNTVTYMEPVVPDKGCKVEIFNADGTPGWYFTDESEDGYSLKEAIEWARMIGSLTADLEYPITFVVEMYSDSTEGESFEIGEDVVINGNGHQIVLEENVTLTNNGTLNDVTIVDPNAPENVSVTDADGNVTYFATLEDAIAAANAGDVVEIIASVLDFDENASSIVVDKAITIKGAGKTATTLNFNSATSAFVIQSSGVTFSDMTITQGTKDNSFHISISKGAWDAPAVQYSDITIENVSFVGGDYALCLIGEDIVVDSCDFTSQDSHNIIIYSVKGNTKITNNAFGASTGNNKSAILYEGGADNATDLSGFIGGGDLTISGNKADAKGVFFQFTNWKLVKDMDLVITKNDVNGTTNKVIALYNMDGAVTASGDEFSSVVINENVFTNTKSGRTIIKEYTGTVEIDASKNYLGSAAPDIAALIVGDKVNVESYYADEALTQLVEIQTGLLGSGTEADPFLINDIDDLWMFAEKVNAGDTYSGKYVKLTADIDLDQEDWTPISKFNGTFDGDNHTISNLWVTGTGDVGFFKQVADQTEYVSGTVKNVTFENATIISESGNGMAGLIANAPLGARITNVKLTGEVTIQGYRGVGGIVGAGFPVITDCSVEAEGTIYATYWGVGGILGFANDRGAKVNNATVKGVGSGLTISSYLGGAGGVTGTPHGAATNGATVSNVTISSKNNYYMAYVDAGGTVNGTVAVEDVVVKVNDEEIVGNDAVASIGTVGYFDFEKAIADATEGQTVTLNKNVAISNNDAYGVTISKAITIDGNGKTITIADDYANTYALLHLYAVSGTVTIKNLTFDGVKSGAAIWALDADIVIDNCVFKNCNDTQVQGLVRTTCSDLTVKNSKFQDNNCNFVITFNFDAAESDTMVIDGCEFIGNTVNDTAVIYYVDGESSTIKDSSFTDNTVSSASHAAIVYYSNGANGTVTGNVFSGNMLTAGGARSSVLALEAGTTATENAFIGNTCSSTAAGTTYVGTVLNKADANSAGVTISGNYWNGVEPDCVNSKGAPTVLENYYTTYENGVLGGLTEVVASVAKIGDVEYATLADAFAAVQEGETIQLLAGEFEFGDVKLPSTLKNVTIKGAAEHASVLKNMTVSAADGNSYSYIGLTFDGIVFDNSRLLFTGWRNGDEIIEDLTVTNCVFKNLNDSTNTAPVHINKDANESVKNFTFTNNVIDGATGGQKSGVYLQATGNVLISGNTINNVSFRPFVVQITSDDGIADNFVVTGNTFSGSSVGRAQGLSNSASGTDSVNVVITNNIFKDITDSQQICYWNFNSEKLTSDLSGNYYDINIEENPSKIYFQSACQNNNDFIAAGLTSYYTELNNDGTINTESLVTVAAENVSVTDAAENVTYYATLADAIAAAQAGDTVKLESDVTLTDTLTIPATANVTLDLNGKTISQTKAQTAGYQMILNDGNLTIVDNIGGGKISYTDSGNGGEYVSNTIMNRGTLVLEGGMVENLSSATVAANGYPYAIDTSIWGSATEVNTVINDGTVYCQNYSALRLRGDSDKNVNVTVNGGEIIGTVEVQNSSNVGAGKLTITGGKLSNSGTANVIFIFGSNGQTNIEAEITGGEFTGNIKMSTSANIGAGFDANFIKGGSFSTDVSDYCADGFIAKENANGTYGVIAGSYVAQVGEVKYETLAAAIAAANEGETVTLISDVTLSGDITIAKSITLDGNGHKLIAADTSATYNSAIMVGDSGWGDDHGETITIKNLEISGWKTNYGVVRAQGVALVMENCVLNENSVSNEAYGVVSLNFTDATVKNCEFIENSSKVIDINFNGDNSNSVVTVDGCTFTENTSTGAGIVVRNDGEKFVLKNSTFIDNTVSTNGNAATVYAGWGSADSVSGCYFEGNSVTTSHATTKRFASAIFCDGCEVTGNAFVDNTATRNGEAIATTVAVGAYYGDANVSQNYWGDDAPVAGVDYTIEFTNKAVAMGSYYASCNVENGTFTLDDLVTFTYVAQVGEVKYETLAAAIAAAEEGDTVTLISDVVFTEATRTHNSGTWYDGLYYIGDKSFTIDLGGFTITHDGSVNDYLLNFKNDGAKANVITIKNGTIDAGTTAFCALCTSTESTQPLTINLEDVNLINNKSNGSTAKIRGAQTILNVNNGTTITGKDSYLAIECVGATVNVYDGAEIYMNGSSSYNGCLVGVCYGGTINVYGGYGKGVKGGFIAMTSGGTINIYGGEWIANTDGTVGDNSNLYVLTAQSNKYESGFVGASIINVNGGTFRGGMDAWVLNNIEGEKAEINITGGNFNVEPTPFVEEGYAALPDLNGNYVVGKKPTATVNDLGATVVAAGDYGVWNGSSYNGTSTEDMPLSFVMQFLADQDAEDMANSPFAEWYGDFVITFTGIEVGRFTADGCYLAGHYGDFGWVKVPVDGLTIEEGVRYPVMLGVGLGQKYDYICSSVEDFKCALYLTPEILAANPNIEVKLELAVVDNSKGSDAAAEALVNNTNVYGVVDYTYEAEDFATPVAKIGNVYYATLAEAIAAANEGDTVTLLADVVLADTLNIAAGKNITLDLAGHVISGACNGNQATLVYIDNGAKLTLQDTVGGGKITYAQGTSNIGWTVDVKGKFVLESGTIELTGTWDIGYAVDVRPNAWGTAYTASTVFTMEGGKIISSDGAVRVASSSSDTYKNISASFVMNGGSIDAAWDGVFVQQSDAIWDKLSVAINGGTIESDLNPIRFYGPKAGSYVDEENCVDIELNGGTLTYTGTESYTWLVDGIIRVGGGCDASDIASAVAASESFAETNVADGYKWVEDANTGKYVLKEVDYVAQVGEVKYETLTAAIAAAQSGNTVTVLADVVLNSTLKITADKNIILDLNGKTIDAVGNTRIAIMSYGDLTIKDSSAEQSGMIKAGKAYDNGNPGGNTINVCAGTFTLESGNIYSQNNGILIDEEAATVTIKGGKITAEPATNNSAVLYISSTSTTVLDITGGEMIGQNGILLWDNTTITISGGSITATNLSGIQGNGSKDVTDITISGGTIAGGEVGIYHPQGGNLTVTGGTITGDTGIVVKGGKVNISGGTIEADGAYAGYTPKSSGYVGTGDALYVEHYDSSTNSENYGTPIVTVTGGTFTSANAKAVASYVNPANNIEALDEFISGGTFNTSVDDAYCASGYISKNNGDGTYSVEPGTYVAQVGSVKYASVIEAIKAAVDSGAAEVKILMDVREVMPTDIEIILNSDLTITADEAVKAEFYNNGTSYDFVVNSNNNNTFTIAENVTFSLVDRVIWLGYYGNNVDVVVDGTLSGYQIWHGADTTVNSTGTIKTTGEAFVMRRGALLKVDGGTVTVNYFNILSGQIFAENANITCGSVWISNTGNYAYEGNVVVNIWSSTLTSNGNLKAEGESIEINFYDSVVKFTDFEGYGASVIGANAKLAVDGEASVTFKNITNNGEIYLEEGSTIAAVTANLTINTDDGYEVVYENGVYKVVEVEDPIVVAVTGRSLLLEDIVQVKYYFGFDPAIKSKITAAGMYIWDNEADAIALNFESNIWHNTEIRDEGIYQGKAEYSFRSDGIAAKEMGDLQYVVGYIVVDGETYYTAVETYSPKTWCEYMKNDSKEKNIAAALMNYGAAAQIRFNYKTDALMNEGFDGYTFTTDMLTNTTRVKGAELNGFKENGYSLVLDGTIQYKIYYLAAGLAGKSGFGIEYQIGNGEIKSIEGFENSTDEYFVKIEDVAAKDLDEIVTIRPFYTENGERVYGNASQFCAETWIYGAMTSTSTTQTAIKDKAIAPALGNYIAAANSRFSK